MRPGLLVRFERDLVSPPIYGAAMHINRCVGLTDMGRTLNVHSGLMPLLGMLLLLLGVVWSSSRSSFLPSKTGLQRSRFLMAALALGCDRAAAVGTDEVAPRAAEAPSCLGHGSFLQHSFCKLAFDPRGPDVLSELIMTSSTTCLPVADSVPQLQLSSPVGERRGPSQVVHEVCNAPDLSWRLERIGPIELDAGETITASWSSHLCDASEGQVGVQGYFFGGVTSDTLEVHRDG